MALDYMRSIYFEEDDGYVVSLHVSMDIFPEHFYIRPSDYDLISVLSTIEDDIFYRIKNYELRVWFLELARSGEAFEIVYRKKLEYDYESLSGVAVLPGGMYSKMKIYHRIDFIFRNRLNAMEFKLRWL